MLKIHDDQHRQNGQQPTHYQQQTEGAVTEDEHTLHFDFTVSDPWHIPGIMRELAEGFDRLAHLPPSIALLGSSRAKPGDAAYLAALVLIQTGKLRHFPVILYDSRYWAGLVTWIRETMLVSDKIQPQDAGLLLLSDDPKEMCNIVLAAYQARSCQEHTHAMNRQEQVLR